MKVLITGAGGFIGSHVARRFQSEGHEVTVVDDFSTGSRKNVPFGVTLIEGDLSSYDISGKLPAKCDLILHLAGQSSGEISFENPIMDLEKNTISTLQLIKYGIDRGVSRIVYASSMSVYGSQPDKPTLESAECHPLSCYGVGKLASEDYLRIYANKLPFICLRMFNVYGPGQDLLNMRQGMVSIFLAQALEQKKIKVKGGLDRYRDFIYIDDVVESWYRAATNNDLNNLTINVGCGNKVLLTTLLETMKEYMPEIEWDSIENTPGDQHGIYADTKLFNKVLKIEKLKTLREGLKLFIDWSKSVK